MKTKSSDQTSLSLETIKDKIYILRGRKVMFDKDLAVLYGVQTKVLNQAVKRNRKRFPEDFMFKLNKDEFDLSLRSQIVILKKDESEVNSRSQSVTLNQKQGSNIKYAPFVFTEQGIAMLSSILNSEKAILINIQIIRAFIKLREMIDSYTELREKVEEMEKNNETNFKEIFRVIRLLINKEEKPKDKIGFNTK